MTNPVRVKICGLTEPKAVDDAVSAGAAYLGFNFFPRSPRYADFDKAKALATRVPAGVAKVSLTVDANDAFLDDLIGTVPIDLLQLHGKESAERIAEIKARYGLPVMKVIGIETEEDLAKIEHYAKVADQLLVDAKPPKGADRPGGNAVAFDWSLIAGQRWPVPWMLAGGLKPENVADAIKATGARQVDVASGVESAPGVKDAALIKAFMSAAQDAV